MGADMLLASLPAFEVTDERLEELRNLLKDEYSNGTLDDFCDDIDRSHDSVEGAIDFLAAGGYEGREVVKFSFGSEGDPKGFYSFWMTGGMSWGDDPTEAFGHLVSLDCVRPLRSLIYKWSREDAALEEKTHGACERRNQRSDQKSAQGR